MKIKNYLFEGLRQTKLNESFTIDDDETVFKCVKRPKSPKGTDFTDCELFCDFNGLEMCHYWACEAEDRHDGKDVVFIDVEKRKEQCK